MHPGGLEWKQARIHSLERKVDWNGSRHASMPLGRWIGMEAGTLCVVDWNGSRHRILHLGGWWTGMEAGLPAEGTQIRVTS